MYRASDSTDNLFSPIFLLLAIGYIAQAIWLSYVNIYTNNDSRRDRNNTFQGKLILLVQFTFIMTQFLGRLKNI